jgi:hypothetical protein
MHRTDLSLDDEIAEVERRLEYRRAQLRLIVAEARSRVSLRNTIPVALFAALGVGFAASRFARRSTTRFEPRSARKGTRAAQLVGALAAALLPRLVRPLQVAAMHWVTQRMRSTAR